MVNSATPSVGSREVVDCKVEKKAARPSCRLAAKLKVGAKVHCLSRKKKYNDLLGTVTKVSKSKVTVKFDYAVDGANLKEYAHDNVSVLEPPPESEDEPIMSAKSIKAKLKVGPGNKRLSVRGGAMPSSDDERPTKQARTAPDATAEPQEKTPETPAVEDSDSKKVNVNRLFQSRMVH